MGKDLALQVINKLPDNATNEQVAEALITILSIIRGVKDFKDGNFTTQEQLEKESKKW